MSWVATTKGIDAGLVGDLMMLAVEDLVGAHVQPPKIIECLTDNGSCYTAAETRSLAKQLGLKRDYAKLAHRPDSQTVMGQLKAWFYDYNSFPPHSALGYLPPQLFRERRSAN